MARTTTAWKLRKHGRTGIYFVRFTHNGKRYEKSTKERQVGPAKAAAARVYTETVTSPEVNRAEGSLEALLPEWLDSVASTRSEAWAKECVRYARLFLNTWSDVNNITGGTVQKYINYRVKKVTAVTVRKELSALRRFLVWAKRAKYISEVPQWETPNAKSDYKAEHPTEEEFASILRHLPSPAKEYYAVMWATSFRRATMQKLKWSDVDLDEGTIRVRASADKRRYDRIVPMTESASAALSGLPHRTGLVFGEADHRTAWRTACKRAGIDRRLTANHSVRHGRLTMLAGRSQNLAAIQYLAGHKTLQSTQKYVHGSLRAARDLLNEVEKGGQSGGHATLGDRAHV